MREAILHAISEERDRQDELFPEQKPSLRVQQVSAYAMVAVLTEEVGEVAKATLEADGQELRAELIQTAAVCVKWLEILALERLPFEFQYPESNLQELGCAGTDADDDPRSPE